jgi:hypothetical protein
VRYRALMANPTMVLLDVLDYLGAADRRRGLSTSSKT